MALQVENKSSRHTADRASAGSTTTSETSPAGKGPVSPIWLAWQVSRHFGPAWMARRLMYLLRCRTGWIARRHSVASWDKWPLQRALSDSRLADPERLAEHLDNRPIRFLFDAKDREAYAAQLARFDTNDDNPAQDAERYFNDQYKLFSTHWVDVDGMPDWHANPITGQRMDCRPHWSRLDEIQCGDVKFIWELNRFAFTFDLVRAYWRTGDERCAELFWQLAEDWRRANEPHRGMNWKCGQEASFRLMAWCFGLFGFAGSPATTPGRVADLLQMINFTGHRIAANLSYGLSQQNNHGISEAAGLWTIGILFPELNRAGEWKRQGRRSLEQLTRQLIYDDGSFCQHSWNYQRVMLHDYLWAIRLGELNGEPLADEINDRVEAAGRLLYQVQEEHTGRVPNYGQNDGALVLPLSDSRHEDFRPVVQATSVVTRGQRVYGSGPWDEEALWLAGPELNELPETAVARRDLAADDGGYFTIRGESSWAFVRCGDFRHRPSQADMLQVDLWWRGQNIAIDAGTYSYHASPPWNNSLAETAQHNTVTVDGLDQMQRAGRFLWLPWLRTRRIKQKYSPGGQLTYWQGEHDGYHRLSPPLTHRRGLLRIGEEHWLVLDQVLPCGAKLPHELRLHWLLADFPFDYSGDEHLALYTDNGLFHVQIGSQQADCRVSVVRGCETSPRGWRASGYGQLQPAISLAATVAAAETLFWSLLGPDRTEIDYRGRELSLRATDWHCEIALGEDGDSPIVESISYASAVSDRLTVTA